ncbi:MAG: RnfABCDGE type electron transport complex subunit G [Odoribacter sp.]|nr:RnfABCDGE type electron transport complex subunit G [Odoribacter sp.]
MGKKLESNFRNMLIVLFAVTLISSAAVAYVFTLTKAPIDEVKDKKQIDAITEVIPGEFNNDPSKDAWKVATESKNDDPYLFREAIPDSLELYPAKYNGQLVGTAVKTFTNSGFSGKIWLMVGFSPEGTITNYSVLEHAETPGLGSKMDTWFTNTSKGNILGKNPSQQPLKVSKDGGDVDAITAATISSRAFLDAINRAASALTGDEDAYSGASESY